MLITVPNGPRCHIWGDIYAKLTIQYKFHPLKPQKLLRASIVQPLTNHLIEKAFSISILVMFLLLSKVSAYFVLTNVHRFIIIIL